MSDWIKNLFGNDDSGDELPEIDDFYLSATDDTGDEEISEEITFEDDSEEDSGLNLFGEAEEEEDNLADEDEEENYGQRLLDNWRKDKEELMQSLEDQRAELQAKIDEIRMQRGMK